MPPVQIGFGPMGLGLRTGQSHVAWEINGVKLGQNASSCRISLEESGKRFQGLRNRPKRLFAHAPGDPRVTGTFYTIEMAFANVNHELFQLFEELMVFFRAPFPIKIGQFNYPNLNSGGADFYDAARLYAATPGSASCAIWFFPRRGISNDSGEGPFIYKNAALVTSGVTIDYTEGTVTFASPPNTTDIIRSYFVWKPRCLINPESTQMVPVPGKIRGRELYNISVSMSQY